MQTECAPAYESLQQYIQSNGLTATGPAIEFSLNDPHEASPRKKIEMQIK
jgi:effector-binding domain-containing protein